MSAHFQRGSLLYQQGRYEQAIGELHMHLAQQAEDYLGHALVALCFAQLHKLDEATRFAERAVHLAPDQPLGHYALSQVMLDRRRLPEAKLAIKEAIRLDPHDPDYFAILASIHLQRSEWREALAAADQGLAVEPEHAVCTNLRVQALVKLGDRAAASATLADALSRRPDDAYTHANQGWTLLHQGQPDKALEHFREALRLKPELDWARAGIVEAMKARNIVYRWMLAYFLWMASLSPQVQWGLIIGLLIGQQVLSGVARNSPALRLFLWPILGCYLVFVLMTWLSYPLFNLLLRLNRFGRYALSPDQIRGANVLLACLFAVLALVVAAIITGRSELWIGVLYFAVLSLPASAIYRCEEGWPRRTAAIITLGLLAASIALVGAMFLPRDALPPMVARLLVDLRKAFPLALIASQFAANYLASVRVKR